MTWFDWVLVAWFAFGAVMQVLWIGKARKPITPTDAAIVLVIQTAFAVGVLRYR